ncbi:sialate O-acetylesterase [Tardiphaga robiniae]|uniref:sialate O-acetylesterase n=1 Tax=Tardiphaga robiniae TaxID=943830 RepID=UPI001585F54B|nr:sialate O-acetylesterase [Tardiphaga robiniae]NUU39633.1 hypothetical protein [Tardiphaga robiniae]
MRIILWALALFLSLASADARQPGGSFQDPGRVWTDLARFTNGGLTPSGDVTVKSVRSSFSVDPAKKLLVLFSAGQSLPSNACPTIYTPSNPSKLHNLDPTTGQIYAAADPLLGTTLQAAGAGVANYNLRLADTFVSNAVFDEVLIVTVAVGATSISQWTGGASTFGPLFRNIESASLKLAARGITPLTTGAIFAVTWNQGESDTQFGTSQAAYQASFAALKAAVDVYLPSVRWFVATESWLSGSVSSAVQAAQAAVVDNVTVFAGANMDSLTSSHRLPDNTHLNDAGAAQAAALTYTAMRASGAPF